MMRTYIILKMVVWKELLVVTTQIVVVVVILITFYVPRVVHLFL
jgi:hypothetical protein